MNQHHFWHKDRALRNFKNCCLKTVGYGQICSWPISFKILKSAISPEQ